MTSYNKFEVLVSRVMRCGVEVRRQEMYEEERRIVEYFKCGKKEYKCKKYPEWKKAKEIRKEKIVCVAIPQKAQQKE